MTIQIAIRLPDELVKELDELVERRRFANRTEAVRLGLERVIDDAREAELDEAILAGYRAVPDGGEFDAMAEAAARTMVEEEPW